MDPRQRIVRVVLVVLALAGSLISFYLTLTHYRDLIPPCYVTSGCESVVTSRYATVLGIPLALIGTLYFVVMFYLGIALTTGHRGLVVRAYDLLAFGGVLAAAALVLLQAVVLRAYCTFCLAIEAIVLLIWLGSLAVTSSRGDATKDKAKSRPQGRKDRR